MAIRERLTGGDVFEPAQDGEMLRAVEELRELEAVKLPERKTEAGVRAGVARNQYAEGFFAVAQAFRTSPPSDKTPNFSMDSRLATGDANSRPLVRIVSFGNPNEPELRITAVHVEPVSGDLAGHHIDISFPVDSQGNLSTHGHVEATISKEEVKKIESSNGLKSEYRTRSTRTYRPWTDERYGENDPAILNEGLHEAVVTTLEFLDSLRVSQ